MNEFDRRDLIEEELLIVRHSGEIPEIALHGSLYYLSEDPDGPGIVLEADEVEGLRAAAAARFREIILRDLEPVNRDLPLYRGLARSMANWKRFQDFCMRCERSATGLKPTVAAALLFFLKREVEDTQSGVRSSSVNCEAMDLLDFATELGLSADRLPSAWPGLCPGNRAD